MLFAMPRDRTWRAQHVEIVEPGEEGDCRSMLGRQSTHKNTSERRE